MEEAGDAHVGAYGLFVDGKQLLFEGEGSGATASEGDGAGAEFGGSVVEDGSVYEILAEEGGVEGGARFKEQAIHPEAFKQSEDSRQIVQVSLQNGNVALCEGFARRCRYVRRTQDQEILSGCANEV